jgi:hypothetical protein
VPTLTQKIVTKISKYDPVCSSQIRSGIFSSSWISDPGVKKAPVPGSATLLLTTIHRTLSLEPEKLLVTPLKIQLLIYFRSHSRPSSSSANNTSSNSSIAPLHTTVSSSGHHHSSLPTTTTTVSSAPALNSIGQLGDNSSHHR